MIYLIHNSMKIVLIVFCLCFVIHGSASGADYYVSTTGNDSNSGTSKSNACRTISSAVAKVGLGDTIYIMPGEYGTEQGIVRTSKGGFTITAYDPDNRPKITGTDNHPFYIRIDGPGSDGVTISHLRIRATTNGDGEDYPGVISFRDGSDSHTIDNCELSHGYSGIILQGGHSHTITNNHIHDMGVWNTDEDAHGIGWYGSINPPKSWNEKTLIAHNIVEYCEGDGLQDVTDSTSNNVYWEVVDNIFRYFGEQPVDIKGANYILFYDNDCSYGNQRTRTSEPHYFAQFHGNNDVPSSNVWIWNNVFHDDDFAAIDNLNCGSNWYIWNNIFYSLMQAPGMNSGAIDIKCPNTYITHNTFYNVRETGSSKKWVTGIEGGEGNNIQNNIFLNVGDDHVDDHGAIYTSGLSGDANHNYIYSSNREDSSCDSSCHPTDSTDVTASDPGFVNENSHDYRLEESSACVDQGATLADSGYYTPNIDKDGNWRDSFPDLGAYEYVQTSPPLSPTPPSNLRVANHDPVW